MSAAGPSPAARAVMWTLHHDRVTAEVGRALATASVPVIVLKGPTFARWLYGPGENRTSVDSDLLVPRNRFREARRVLGRCGFRWEATSAHSESWRRRGDGAGVDLHHTLGAVPRSVPVWDALASRTEPIEVGGARLLGLAEPARCLHVALHVTTSHGQPRPVEDLRRAVAVAEPGSWTEAVALADRFTCRDRLAAGLASDPAGARLAESIGLGPELAPGGPASRVALAESRSGVERGIGRVLALPTARDRLGSLARSLVPSRSLLRARWGWARGPLLPVAYACRLVSGPPGVVVGAWRWRRSRRSLVPRDGGEPARTGDLRPKG